MFNQYPYLNLNDLNLDYLLNEIKSMYNDVTNFVSINAIKYADPIQWNITSQYEKNTVVIDPLTGTAYISVAPVPSGVALTRTEYWTVVFDLGSFVTRAAQNFTSHWESDTTTTATFSTSTGGWLVWGDVLYKALTNITAGDTYVVGSNIEHFTIEDLYNAYLNTIARILAMIGDLDDLDTWDKTSIVKAINSVKNDVDVVSNKVGNLNDLTTSDKSTVVNAVNSIITERGSLSNLTTDDKNSIVNAINELNGVLTPTNTNLSLLMNSDYTKNKTIVIFGDSFGQGIPQATLEKYLPYATIYNACAGGTTVGKIVTDRNGLQTAYNTFRSTYPDVVPDIVLLFGFNNDAYAWAENEDSIRSTNPFGSITTATWSTTFGAVTEFINSWRDVNNNIKFGLIPYIALSDSGYFKIAKGAIDSGLMHYPHSKPVSILWLENFYDINHYDYLYWNMNDSHPTTAQYNEIIAPILCKWLQSGMPNQKFPHGVYTIMTDGTGDDIVLKVKAAANELSARLSTASSSDMTNMPNGLYIVSVDTSLDSCPLGNITYRAFGGEGAYYVFTIENTTSNMYSAWLKPNSQSVVYVKSQLS